MNVMHVTLLVSLLATTGLPEGPEAQVVLPDMVAEVRAFVTDLPQWNKDLVNVLFASWRPGDRGQWYKDHWLLVNSHNRSD